jgi:hypothetical protein
MGRAHGVRRGNRQREELQVKIRTIVETDRGDWLRLREALWPGSLSDHDAETRKYFEKALNAPIVFVAEAHGRVVGFLELDYRKYAPGCSSSPVPFIEGWFASLGCNERESGGRSPKLPKHMRAAPDIMRLPATQRLRTQTALPLTARWATRKSSVSCASANRCVSFLLKRTVPTRTDRRLLPST